MRPSCPEVGRSQRPDLIARQRGAAAAVKQRQPCYEQPKRSTHSVSPRRCLIRRRRPRYPATASTSPTEAAEAPYFHAYDPYATPSDGANPGLTSLDAVPAERIPPRTFEELSENDIPFIDSPHVVKVGGDVTFLVLEVLPGLRPGVIVHFHDVFLPWHYPREWVEHDRWYWAEQYLLHAFLAFNAEFEVLLAGHAVARLYPERFNESIPNYDPSVPPLAFWIKRASPGGVGAS